MSGFQFPPPPPPPPKASNGDGNQSGQSNRGRGRGRNRGGSDFRGRGGRGRGIFSHPRGQHQGNLENSYGQSHGHLGGASGAQSFPQYGLDPAASLPPGSYVNPAFHHKVSTSGYANNSRASLPTNGATSAQESPQRTAAGHKRKLDALRGPAPEQKKSGPPTAPSVPSFGTPILPVKEATSQVESTTVQSKRSSNALGLTPQDDQPQYSSDSDDEGVDEEAMYAELGTNLTFEHNGNVMSLNTAADLAAWKNERLKNFPTKQRLAAKLQEKRRIGDERKRLLSEASQALRAAQGSKSRTQSKDQTRHFRKPSEAETELEKARKALATQTETLEQLRKRVAESEEKAARARRTEAAGEKSSTMDVDSLEVEIPATDSREAEGHGRGGDNTIAAPSTSLAGKHDVGADETSSTSPTASSDSDVDNEEPPEETRSTLPVAGDRKKKVCRYFAASGSCRDGDLCRYRHELDPRTAAAMAQERQQQIEQRNMRMGDYEDEDKPISSRKSIFDRLVEQEQGHEDKLALQVIKHLGEMGLFSKEADAPC